MGWDGVTGQHHCSQSLQLDPSTIKLFLWARCSQIGAFWTQERIAQSSFNSFPLLNDISATTRSLRPLPQHFSKFLFHSVKSVGGLKVQSYHCCLWRATSPLPCCRRYTRLRASLSDRSHLCSIQRPAALESPGARALLQPQGELPHPPGAGPGFEGLTLGQSQMCLWTRGSNLHQPPQGATSGN